WWCLGDTALYIMAGMVAAVFSKSAVLSVPGRGEGELSSANTRQPVAMIGPLVSPNASVFPS
ncbi:MAG: hypothetical protein ACREV3_05500, partial [Gammaproteobacteria bacterium]